jgi:hypothetical protein
MTHTSSNSSTRTSAEPDGSRVRARDQRRFHLSFRLRFSSSPNTYEESYHGQRPDVRKAVDDMVRTVKKAMRRHLS